MLPEYTKDTTDDDVIEHILMRLNNDYLGGCLSVPDFCGRNDEGQFDTKMAMIVRQKMYDHNVAKKCSGNGQNDWMIELAPKGIKVQSAGGWKKYLIEFEKEQIRMQEQERQKYNQLNINAPIFGSQIGQGSDFGNLESSQSLINTEHAAPKNEAINSNKSEELNIWQKIYKWTDHKLISIIIGGILGFLATKLLLYLGWLNC